MYYDSTEPAMAAPLAPAQNAAAVSRVSMIVTAICWFGLFSEGYDLGAFGAVLPILMSDKGWHLGPAIAGMVASATLVGMFFGGFGFGVVADRYGRKPTFIACLSIFSLASAVSALAPSPLVLGLCRLIAGVGIGGIVPVAAALTSEYAAPGKANRQFALMYTGYSLGIFAASLVSFGIVQHAGWRVVVGIGGVPLLLLPLVVAFLPESLDYLCAKGRDVRAHGIATRLGLPMPGAIVQSVVAQPKPGLSGLFRPGYIAATLGFWFATFAGMIIVYGLNTWLPQIMREAGYDLGPSILFLGVFALAAAAGGLVLGLIADRYGRKQTIVGAFAIGAGAIMALSRIWPLPMTYMIVAISGIGSVSAAVMVTSYLASYFPATLRATAVGSALSFSRFGAVCGPLLGGLIAQYNLAIAWNFALFAAAALVAAASILLVPPLRRESGGED